MPWKIFLSIMYVTSAVLIASNFLGISHPADLIREGDIWIDVPYWSPVAKAYLVMMPLCALLIFHTMFTIRYRAFKSKNRIVMKQIDIMALSGIPFAIVGNMLNIVAPNLNIKVPSIGHLFIGIWILFVGYAITKYKFMVPTLEYASKQIFTIAGEVILITDLKLEITEHNSAFEEQLGYSNTSGLFLYDIILDNGKLKADAECCDLIESRVVEVQRREGGTMHAKLKCAILYNEKIKIGMVFILSDITELINLNTELENKIANRTKMLAEAKEEAEHRLHITQIYTRRSIVDMIKEGIDPTMITPIDKNVTILFSDIRNFTALSENMTALTTVRLLNQYFEKMNQTVIDHGGEIDKLIGDCIMALFDDPEDAIDCAMAMRSCLIELNDENQLPKRLNSGIGINYGEVTVGNIGSGSKMDLTVIGDIVNSASRLEALTKVYQLPIIISEVVAKKLKGQHDLRFIDHVLVKGKRAPMRIYEIYDHEKDEIKQLKEKHKDRMADAFAIYTQGDFARAAEIYREILDDLPAHSYNTNISADPVVDFYLKRSLSMKEKQDHGLLKEWNGIYEFMEK
jgi:PAS domain S-box-containing protein